MPTETAALLNDGRELRAVAMGHLPLRAFIRTEAIAPEPEDGSLPQPAMWRRIVGLAGPRGYPRTARGILIAIVVGGGALLYHTGGVPARNLGRMPHGIGASP